MHTLKAPGVSETQHAASLRSTCGSNSSLQFNSQYETIIVLHNRFRNHEGDQPRMAKDKKGAGNKIAPAKGKLGIMIPGMGAVATTFVAGVHAVRRGHAKPSGTLPQIGTV